MPKPAYVDSLKNLPLLLAFGRGLREFIQAEGAAAEVQNIVVRRDVRFEFFRYKMNALFAVLFALEQSSFPHDAEML